MNFIGIRSKINGSSDKIRAGFRGVVDFDYEVVVGVIILEVRIVWFDFLVLFHIYTTPAGYIIAFEGLVGAGGTW